jgi:acetyl/propionyl-CoA carboxylase alpha subunit
LNCRTDRIGANMKKKVIIPNRGVIALDIIDSLKSLGLETILLHSPEDANSLPGKMADRSYKFYSSRLEDSYLDMEAIIDRALELKADYIHPGYGFLSESPEFAQMCADNHIKFIGPNPDTLKATRDKIEMRKRAEKLGVRILPYSSLIKKAADIEAISSDLKYPQMVKPLYGSGGKGIRVVEFKKEAQERLAKMLASEENQKYGVFMEEFLPYGHQIEIPFFRDVEGNILFSPEIESSIQRRFQKIFQESPSVNISESIRHALYEDSRKLIDDLGYVGLGYVEFIVQKDMTYFSEINPSFQINTLIPEIHQASNFLKKQYALNNGELLHKVKGVKTIKPKYHVLLASLMAENPFDNFQPSSGTVTEFYNYSTIRNVFKTYLYAGANVSPFYDPYLGKILTFSGRRDHSLNDMKNFLHNIIIRGIKTNLPYFRHLIQSECLAGGDTIIDFINLKCDFSNRKKSKEDIAAATALLSAAFHIDNQKTNYKARLATRKQPGLLKRLFNRM